MGERIIELEVGVGVVVVDVVGKISRRRKKRKKNLILYAMPYAML
tara:strand:+ start:41 stop:175 length:135 start_codon:yes stop_codon:yes gene_type:complete